MTDWFNKGLDDAANGEFNNHPGNPDYGMGYNSVRGNMEEMQYYDQDQEQQYSDPPEPDELYYLLKWLDYMFCCCLDDICTGCNGAGIKRNLSPPIDFSGYSMAWGSVNNQCDDCSGTGKFNYEVWKNGKN